MKILLIYESNSRVGLGHLRRSSELVLAFEKENISIKSIDLSKIDTLNATSVDALILDLPRSSQFLDRFSHISRKLCIALDWYGDKDVDINFCVFEPTPASARIFVASGLQYSIIRTAIREAKKNVTIPNSVLITLGGGDLLKQSDTAFAALSENFNCVIPSNIYSKRSTAFVQDNKLLIHSEIFTHLFSSSQIIISNGGTTLLESIFLNKSVVPLPQTKLEMAFCTYLLKNGYIFNFGINNLYYKVLESLKERRLTNIDGLGSSRITNFIINELKCVN